MSFLHSIVSAEEVLLATASGDRLCLRRLLLWFRGMGWQVGTAQSWKEKMSTRRNPYAGAPFAGEEEINGVGRFDCSKIDRKGEIRRGGERVRLSVCLSGEKAVWKTVKKKDERSPTWGERCGLQVGPTAAGKPKRKGARH